MTRPEGFNWLPAEWRAYIVALESMRSTQGEGEACYYCHLPIHGVDSIRGGPIGLCHADEPGVVKWHHSSCVAERLVEREPVPSKARSAALEEAAKVCEDFRKNDPETVTGIVWRHDLATAIRALQRSPARVAEGATSVDETCLVIQRAVSDYTAPESPAKEQPVKGTYVCPLCGLDSPHDHSDVKSWPESKEEIEKFIQQVDITFQDFGRTDVIFQCSRRRLAELLEPVFYFLARSDEKIRAAYQRGLAAKEQPGERNAAPGGGIQPVDSENVVASEDRGRYQSPSVVHADQATTKIPAVPVAAPDVAAMVRRLREVAGGADTAFGEDSKLRYAAAALIEKLGQQYNDLLTATGETPPPPEHP